MSKLSVTVLVGGPDAERDVSIMSGTAVANALIESGQFTVDVQYIDRPTITDIQSIKTDVFFPVVHGPFGEGGPLQQLLEDSGLPFVGSESGPSAIAMNKVATKDFAQQIGIQTPQWCTMTKDQMCTVPPPIILKPIDDGSSFDIAICMNDDEIEEARKTLHQTRDVLLAEKYIRGREVTVGIIDNEALPIIEILSKNDLDTYDFDAKYTRDDTQYLFDTALPSHSCVEDAMKLFKQLQLRDLARADFIIDREGAWFLEINSMPGFTQHSLVPMAAKQEGIEMPALCVKLVKMALSRLPNRGN